MKRLTFAMQFRGSATPVDGSPNRLKAETVAGSCTLATHIGPGGVSGAIQPSAGGSARFVSTVAFTSESLFEESGEITFGDDGHALRFSTVGTGSLGPSPEPGLSHGAVIWRIDGGTGQFAGATGLIASNFTVSDKGEVVDNQLVVLFLP